MTSLELLRHLYDLDVKLWAEGDRLRCHAPTGVLTPALRAQLSEHKTEILALLRQASVTTSFNASLIKTVSRSRNLPLSFAQEQLWFLDQLEPGSSNYNLSIAVRLTGQLDHVVFEQSLNEIVRRHEILRTNFPSVDGRAHQAISPFVPLDLPLLDLSTLPIEEREEKARQQAAEEARRPFDLQRSSLLRSRLLRLSDAEHVLLVTLHHIVCDGWSLTILMRELAALYRAFAEGSSSPLEELSIQYADYAVWQRGWMQGEVIERQLRYWSEQLEGVQSVELKRGRRVRPTVQGRRGEQQVMVMEGELIRGLRRLSERGGVTLFMTMLAGFQSLLYRYTSLDDIAIATRIAGRNRVETEGLIGFFVNALVLRTNLSGNPTFREALRRVRGVCLDAYAHQDLPFEYLVKALRHRRDASQHHLLQVMLVLENLPSSELELPGLTLKPFEIEHVTVTSDLDLAISEEPQGMAAVMTYDADLFDAVTITRMLDHFKMILESVVSDPDQRIGKLPLLTEQERKQVLYDRNDTKRDYPNTISLVELFESQVERTPDAIALIWEENSVSYRELNSRANQLAYYLDARGVGPEAPVAVYLERSVKNAVALLGILKAGGAYLPLDIASPKAHLSSILEATAPPVVLTTQRLAGQLPDSNTIILCLDSEWETITREHEANPRRTATSENLAYVIYTSGSTGQPKGVAVTQRQLHNRFAWMWRAYPFEAGEVACQRTTLNFAVSIYELLAPLLQGIPTVIIANEVVKDPQRLIQTLDRYNVTRIMIVPTLLRAILDTEVDLAHRLARLKLWTVLGEPLPTELCRRFHERLPQATLLNDYGASEVTAITCYESAQQACNQLYIPAGRPIDNIQVYLLDNDLQPVPIGVPGEIYVGGDGLARGYFKHPEMTAERFIANPFSLEGGSRLYKTGDLARQLQDGNIEHLGRTDQQVKIGATRIELGAIEATLRQHRATRDAAVMVREDENGHKHLIAYLVTNQKSAPAAIELRRFLTERVPGYMIPSRFVWLAELPLTSNGKLDRQALFDLGSESQVSRGPLRPETESEEILAGVWAEVLGVERVGVEENFFELGGDSILSIQIMARARQAGIEVTAKQMFEQQTVRELAAVAHKTGEERGAKDGGEEGVEYPGARLTERELRKLSEIIGRTQSKE